MYLFCLGMVAEKLDAATIPVMEKSAKLKKAVLDVLGVRLAKYDNSIEEDEALLKTDLSVRKGMAIQVRLGEKRIIKKAMDRVEAWDVLPPAKRIKT
jgi:Rubisco LSMT substrate-binding